MAFRITDRSRNRDTMSRRTKVDLICFAVIILVATAFFMTNDATDKLGWDDQQLTLSLSETTVYTIAYDEITDVMLVENVDFGTCLSGENGRRQICGVWKNDLMGEYVLCAYPNASPIIQISTNEEDYWIALDNSDTTIAFYEAFVIMLTDAGYDVG